MTVSTQTSRIIVQGNGVTTVFNYTFPITGASATDQTNCRLVYTDALGVSTTQANNLWSITGVVTQAENWTSGTFQLSTSTPITTGTTLTLERTVPYTQPTELGNQGAYSPEVVEAALDNLALQTEQLNTWRLQSIRAPITDVALNDMPGATARAGGYLTFDSSGQPTISQGAQSAVITGVATPGGRLTLTANTPVMTTDSTAATTVHYCTYTNNTVPVWNGTTLVGLAIVSDDISLTLNVTDNVSAHIYDVFGFSNSGVLAIGTGPAWTSNTARGSGAGTTELQLKSGLWTNKNSIALRSNGALLATVSANQATYLGSVYTTANGQTGMAMKPAAASGGSNNILGLYNAYNSVLITAIEVDSTSNWTYATSTPRPTNNSTSNRISWVDGLAQSAVNFSAHVAALISASTPTVLVFVNVDATSGFAINLSQTLCPAAASSINYNGAANPLLGFHYVQQMEYAQSGTAQFIGEGNYQYLTLTIPM